MGIASTEIRYQTVHKDYLKDEPDHEGYYREIRAYTELDWATPKLMWHGDWWLEVERLVPILDLAPDQSRRYEKPLRDLLQAIHDAGWWHRDIDLSNVVIHPMRGPLLIDWEWLTESSGPVSYDLFGPAAAGVDPAWAGEGVSWHCGANTIPGKFWS